MHNLDYSIMHLIHRAAQGTDALFGKRSDDLTPRQFVVLDTIQRMGAVSQVELVRTTGIDRSTMSDMIFRLMKKNLVRRRRSSSDARAYRVTLTEQAQALLDELRAKVEEVDRIILNTLPERERKSFVRGLHVLAESVVAGESITFRVD